MKIVSVPIANNTKKIITTLCYGVGMTWLFANSVYAVDLKALDDGHNFKIKATELFSVDSNPLRLVAGSDTLMGSEFSPEFIFGDITPTHKVYLNTLINYNVYDDSIFDTINFHETLGLFKSNQRWSIGVVGLFDYDTTRSSEITSFGIAAADVRHTGLTAIPQLSFNLTEIDKLSLNGNISRELYDGSAYIGNKYYSLAPSYSHNFDPNNAGSITLNLQRYQSDDANESRTDSIGPLFGWTSVINKELDTRISAGFEQTNQEIKFGISPKSKLNYVFSASANFKGQQDIASLTASRSQQQFGNGGASLLTAFDIKEAHSLNHKITFNAGSNYSYTDNSSFSTTSLDKQFIISGGISYHLSNKVDLTTNYQYVSQKLTGSSGSIKEQILLIGIGYHPDFNPI
jgi:hypothetical protein